MCRRQRGITIRRNPKSEFRIPNPPAVKTQYCILLWISGFGLLSDFEIRISDLPNFSADTARASLHSSLADLIRHAERSGNLISLSAPPVLSFSSDRALRGF
jgi:hypothetical protein